MRRTTVSLAAAYRIREARVRSPASGLASATAGRRLIGDESSAA
jgi:hypothetical protein